jgi:hypothetical protein
MTPRGGDINGNGENRQLCAARFSKADGKTDWPFVRRSCFGRRKDKY